MDVDITRFVLVGVEWSGLAMWPLVGRMVGKDYCSISRARASSNLLRQAPGCIHKLGKLDSCCCANHHAGIVDSK